MGDAALTKLDADIAEVTRQIEAADNAVQAAEDAVRAAEARGASPSELQRLQNKEAQLRTDKAQLRTEKEQLRTEKAQLRTEKAQLRTEKELLLRAQLERDHKAGTTVQDPPLVSVPPSTFGKPSQWQAAQFPVAGGTPPFFCFTPPHSFPDALPACLVSPVFGAFSDGVHAQEYPVSMEDYEAVYSLCNAVCNRAFANEEDLTRVLNLRLKHFGLNSSDTSVPGCSARFDGLQCVIIGGQRAVTAVGEWKNGTAASSTDTEYQLMACAYAIVRAAAERSQRVYLSSACPMLGVEVVGRMIRFSAMACCDGKRIQWEPLTPFLSLLPMLQAQPRDMRVLATALCCFRTALRDLEVEQVKRAAVAVVTTRAAPSNPYALPYTLQNDARLAAVEPLLPAAGDTVQYNTILYRAILLSRKRARDAPSAAAGADAPPDASPDVHVLVKFVHGSYGAAVHAAWAAAGLAPRLFEASVLPGSITQVIMEELRTPEWVCAANLSATQLQEWLYHDRVRAALARAHALPLPAAAAGGTAEGAHGDCRPANIMLHAAWQSGSADEGVRFIDFDWSGEAGVARYPPFMSTRVKWPPGVAPGLTLAQAHDVALWTSTTSLGPPDDATAAL